MIRTELERHPKTHPGVLCSQKKPPTSFCPPQVFKRRSSLPQKERTCISKPGLQQFEDELLVILTCRLLIPGQKARSKLAERAFAEENSTCGCLLLPPLLLVWKPFSFLFGGLFSLVDSPGTDFPGNLFRSFFRQICPLAQFRPERPEPAYFLSLAFSSPTPSVRDVPNFKLYRLDGLRPRYGQVNLAVSTPKRPSGHETVGFGILPGHQWGETSFTCFDT